MTRQGLGLTALKIMAVAPVLLCVTACTPATEDATVVIFAAASTAPVVDSVVAHVETAQPGADITVTYGGSADLAAQINEGAPAAVFVSANEAQMAAVAQHTSTHPPQVFAMNHLTIVVPTGNPGAVTGLADLGKSELTSVVCAPQVPCGAATAQLAALDDLTLAPSSQENSVTDVLGKVTSGQADAGVVYVTDVARASGVEEVPIPGSDRVLNRYQVAALDDYADNHRAAAFVTALLGDAGRAALTAAGFTVPHEQPTMTGPQ